MFTQSFANLCIVILVSHLTQAVLIPSYFPFYNATALPFRRQLGYASCGSTAAASVGTGVAGTWHVLATGASTYTFSSRQTFSATGDVAAGPSLVVVGGETPSTTLRSVAATASGLSAMISSGISTRSTFGSFSISGSPTAAEGSSTITPYSTTTLKPSSSVDSRCTVWSTVEAIGPMTFCICGGLAEIPKTTAASGTTYIGCPATAYGTSIEFYTTIKPTATPTPTATSSTPAYNSAVPILECGKAFVETGVVTTAVPRADTPDILGAADWLCSRPHTLTISDNPLAGFWMAKNTDWTFWVMTVTNDPRPECQKAPQRVLQSPHDATCQEALYNVTNTCDAGPGQDKWGGTLSVNCVSYSWYAYLGNTGPEAPVASSGPRTYEPGYVGGNVT